MSIRQARVINKVFEACLALCREHESFTAESVIAKLDLPTAPNREGDYWQKKNITNSLNVLEAARFISGAIHPEFTANINLVKEVRSGKVTSFGDFLGASPTILRLTILSVCIQKRRILAILGVLSFLRLANNAYIGTTLVVSWFEYIAATIVIYILYLCLLKILNLKD